MTSRMYIILLSFISASTIRNVDGESWAKFSGRGGGGGMLYPRESESRQIQLLDGMWNFRADTSDCRCEGLFQKWYLKPLSQTGPLMPMPVPSSFNDVTVDAELQNFVGWVWYDRLFYVASEWRSKRIVLRIDSAHYNSIVWVNGMQVMSHSGGHLPFEAQVNSVLNFTSSNRITVAVNNTLTPHTLPPGSITYYNNSHYPPGYFVQNYQFDFFNYAGIHRHIQLYTTPLRYIDDITVNTDFSRSQGIVQYSISVLDTSHDNHISATEITDEPDNDLMHNRVDTEAGDIAAGILQRNSLTVEVLSVNGTSVARSSGADGKLMINNVRLWWPYNMNNRSSPYLYTLQVSYAGDVYRLLFGVRTVRVTDSHVLINDRPFYCLGVGKHEDADIRGRGLDLAMVARDFALMKWLGADCFRTSHYPYAEEILQQADELGFVVFDESPAVGLIHEENFSNASLSHHLEVMSELVTRDKNHPSVIVWSVANEPDSTTHAAQHYFKTVIDWTRSLDVTHRPVTFAMSGRSTPSTDTVAELVDILCINRYYGWYHDVGHLDTIAYQLTSELMDWYRRYQRPLIITEYGADTVPGLHSLPAVAFTEDFQAEFLQHYHVVFDKFRHAFLAGEMVWNFADFMTPQGVTRVLGNRKGLFTRQRQPKMSAHVIRHRYSNITRSLSLQTDC